MTAASEEPLTKITINVFTKDLDVFKAIYGHGYSTEMREVFRKHIRTIAYSKQREFAEYEGD